MLITELEPQWSRLTPVRLTGEPVPQGKNLLRIETSEGPLELCAGEHYLRLRLGKEKGTRYPMLVGEPPTCRGENIFSLLSPA